MVVVRGNTYTDRDVVLRLQEQLEGLREQGLVVHDEEPAPAKGCLGWGWGGRRESGRCHREADAEHAAYGIQEGVLGVPVEILHHAVVRKNLQLARGEEHAEEPVIFLLARVIRVCFAALASHADGAGGA